MSVTWLMAVEVAPCIGALSATAYMIYLSDERIQLLPRATSKPLAWLTEPSLFLYVLMGALTALAVAGFNLPSTLPQLVVQSFLAGITGGGLLVRSTVRVEREKVLAFSDALSAIRGPIVDGRVPSHRSQAEDPQELAEELRYVLDDQMEDVVATLAERDKAVAFVFVAVELERAVARLAATAGLPSKQTSLSDMLRLLGTELHVPEDMLDALRAIGEQRNSLMHSRHAEATSEAELDRLLAVGLRLFRLIQVETVLLDPRRIG